MDITKLKPILNKESILKTANARELQQSPEDVLQRYTTYALTHVPLGDTSKQLANLQRVIIENKKCAVGTVVGPYGYGKTSTAVHLWSEIRGQKILSVPPFLWTNLNELMDAVYNWIHYEFSQGPKAFVPQLESVYKNHREKYQMQMVERLGDADAVQELIDEGRLLLDVRASDVISFFNQASQICESAGYKGMIIFTDELQATLAKYQIRDQFFADLFEMVKDILGLPGHWAMVLTMDDDTEGIIARLRNDLLQRLQYSALHFRVKDVYNRREYPKELWEAFEKRFGFIGDEVILDDTLEAIGQVASRSDLGAGPRMVTNAMALAIKHFERTNQAYTPLHFVDDFLAGLMVFDQRGKFGSAVRKALDSPEVRTNEANQQVVKLLSAYPMGCTEDVLNKFCLLQSFQSFPPLARRELIVQQSGGFILRYLAEEELPPEQIEQRLTKEFVLRFAPGKAYAVSAAAGFLRHILIEPIFGGGFKSEGRGEQNIRELNYKYETLQGTFDQRYPERLVNVMVAVLNQSPSPEYEKANQDAEIEYRFELNYGIVPGEPSRLLISSDQPNVAIFQLNISSIQPELATKVVPHFLFDYYGPDQITPLLCLSLIDYLYKNRGELPDDQSRVNTVIGPLRQFALSVLLGDALEVSNTDFAGGMVGGDRIKDIFRTQCRKLYPSYSTLITTRNWQSYLQQYKYAIEKIISQDGVSVARGRRPWSASKEEVADTFHIAGRKLTTLEVLVDALSSNGLLEKVQFSGRSSSSEVSIKFTLHPLEEEWLKILDASNEHVNFKGLDVPAVPAEKLLRQGKRQGYTDAELQEIIRLLVARKYLDFEPKQNVFVRTIDDVVDLRESVQAAIDQLEKDIRALQDALPDFDDRFYSVTKLKNTLEDAKERDEIEEIRNELRQMSGRLNGFVGSRSSNLREKLRQEQETLYTLVRNGLPVWLTYSFEPNPLFELLEKQRNSLVSAYQSTLDEIRHARDDSVRKTQDLSGSNIQVAIRTYDLLRDFTDKSRKLTTRLQNFQDQQEDLDAWRQVSLKAAQLDADATSIHQVYEYGEFKGLVEHLWESIKAEFETDPYAILTRHAKARDQIGALGQRLNAWVENRRSDFEQKCQGYEQSLAKVNIQTDLRVPFDQEHPAESVEVMLHQVQTIVANHLEGFQGRLNQALVVIRYGIKVQNLPLIEAETQIIDAIERTNQLSNQVSLDSIRDLEQFNSHVIQPIVHIAAQEKALYAEMRTAFQQRPAEGTEEHLITLLRSSVSGQQVDLRGLITNLIESGDQNIDLEILMADLKSLFQKNQIAIHINLIAPEDH